MLLWAGLDMCTVEREREREGKNESVFPDSVGVLKREASEWAFQVWIHELFGMNSIWSTGNKENFKLLPLSGASCICGTCWCPQETLMWVGMSVCFPFYTWIIPQTPNQLLGATHSSRIQSCGLWVAQRDISSGLSSQHTKCSSDRTTEPLSPRCQPKFQGL